MPYGAIYIAHNLRDGDITFKVGKTGRLVEERMKELTSSTSNLGAYTAQAYFIVCDIDAAEQACHRALHRYRVQDNREFFEIPLSRLIQIVSEQVKAHAACNFVPELDRDDQSRKNLSAADLLNNARESHTKNNQLWDEALASARETASQWSSLLRKEVLHASEELRSEDTLKWDISSSTEMRNISINNKIEEFLVCTVKVVSLFSKEPLTLSRSGSRFGIYSDDLDLSRAIGEPKIKPSTVLGKDSEHVNWKELDDGRIGCVELYIFIANNQDFLRESGDMPFPEIGVRASAIRYDDYRENFKDYYSEDKEFIDPMEAFEVFLALIVENTKVPQYDVRCVSSDGKKIRDKGEFETDLLEDLEE